MSGGGGGGNTRKSPSNCAARIGTSMNTCYRAQQPCSTLLAHCHSPQGPGMNHVKHEAPTGKALTASLNGFLPPEKYS